MFQGIKKRKVKTDGIGSETAWAHGDHDRNVGKKLLTRIRHRPGSIFLVVVAAVTFLTARNKLASRNSALHVNTSDSLGQPCLWPLHAHKGPTTSGRDPVDDLPQFSEVYEMPDPLYSEFVGWHGDEYEPPPKPDYKIKNNDEEDGRRRDIPDPFPLLTRLDKAGARAILPRQHNTATRTPLFIGFTRNWPLLLQCVTSYMAAGWPARDIYVVENTGTMGANKAGRLSLQNPFFANHTQLVESLGVNVLETPTLFSFAQLQNFYLYTAQQMGWPHFFWSHQDAVVFSEAGYVDDGEHDDVVGVSVEDADGNKSPALAFRHYKRSLHHRALATLKILTENEVSDSKSESQPQSDWATHFFDYDRLTLVNVEAHMAVGAWDTHIAFYAGDCDMYLRLKWAGYWQGTIAPAAGRIFDVAGVLDDLAVLFGIPGVRASIGGRGARGINHKMRNTKNKDPSTAVEDVDDIVYVVEQMQVIKNEGNHGVNMLEPIDYLDKHHVLTNPIELSDRNAWQRRQRGGQGEPFYRDPEGFEAGIQIQIAGGRRVFGEKWGHQGCDLDPMGIKPEDAWKLEPDWEDSKFFGGGW